jgi:pimeloyl-ACP methyl ester carboxylesterase
MPGAMQIVFIHGMYMNGHSWAPWAQRATARGYDCTAPSWPYHEGEPAARRPASTRRWDR